MDLESINRWEDYSRAKDEMMLHTDTPTSPWFVVESDVKKHARLNMIAHLLSTIPYAEVPAPDVELPDAAHRDLGLPETASGEFHLRARLRSHAAAGSRRRVMIAKPHLTRNTSAPISWSWHHLRPKRGQ